MKMTKEQRELLLQGSKLEVRREDGQPAKIIGYAVRWNQLSKPIFGMFQERFMSGAFSASLINPDVYASWQHNSSEVLGRTPNTLLVTEDELGLRYEITPPSWAEKYLETIERGDVRGSSFIFRAVREEWDESNEDMPIRTVHEAELYEVSPVTTPAYPQSSVGVRSAEETFHQRNQEQRADGTPSPAYAVGSEVQVSGTPHVEGHGKGQVREAVLTYAYGIVFEGMEDMGVHHWYTESELAAEAEADDEEEDIGEEKEPDDEAMRSLDMRLKKLNL
ncbi:hypothetical protein BSK66_31575 [Paenibacillus odorifer]|uniref:Prohead serine protease domain-containing protein n=2 Tax=Paenibacillus TaxID=44249 RepID=A0A1R0XBB8_9BACL|nr:HK97 family phage prohead protease [Paenibacillus sp. FSL H8-237]ETT61250.1 putative prophage LambdaBa01, prohead protease [Paenibacillus sp. FSL H8-237]OMD32217.1 hypothetical protein BJP51_16705 [Paenibacillus odorifer]OME46765.1 hypothetical protein BSK66_31575 [Paenibacillus odorifer]